MTAEVEMSAGSESPRCRGAQPEALIERRMNVGEHNQVEARTTSKVVVDVSGDRVYREPFGGGALSQPSQFADGKVDSRYPPTLTGQPQAVTALASAEINCATGR